jgi:hypothetical protein
MIVGAMGALSGFTRVSRQTDKEYKEYLEARRGLYSLAYTYHATINK